MSNAELLEKEEKKSSTTINIGIARGMEESVGRHGSAAAEDIVALTGTRVKEDGTVFHHQKSHLDIADSKVNPEYKEQNISQQAGFNAEIAHTTKKNKENILKGNKQRVARTDDVKGANGRQRVNDPVADIVTLDSKGNPIASTEAQMKFVIDPNGLCDEIVSGKYERYLEKDVKLLLPSEQVASVKTYCKNKEAELLQQSKHLSAQANECKANGNHAEAERLQNIASEKVKQASRYKKLGNNIGDSNLTKYSLKEYKQKEAEFRKKAEAAKKEGDLKKAEKMNKQADKYDLEHNLKQAKKNKEELQKKLDSTTDIKEKQKIKKKLKDAEKRVHEEEQNFNSAIDALKNNDSVRAWRENPIGETIKSIGGTAHSAGIQGAKCGALIGGSVSVIQNILAYAQDKKDLKEALTDTAENTLKSAAMGYVTAGGGTIIKSTLEQAYGVGEQLAINAARKACKEAGKHFSGGVKKAAQKAFENSTAGKLLLGGNKLAGSSLPVLAISIVLETKDAVALLVKGEIDAADFMARIGESGTGMLLSGYTSAIGQIVIPIPVVGAAIGGMIGYTMSSLFYQTILSAYSEEKAAKENYLRVKEECEEARRVMSHYQVELQNLFDTHMAGVKQELSTCFATIDNSISSGDINEFSCAANKLGSFFGKQLQFETIEEFNEFMESDETLTI